jgi:hypothetical protein
MIISLAVDISVTNGMAVYISNLIGFFFDLQPEAVKLYHFVRNWLRINRISFKSFTLVLLVILFMQEKKFLPKVPQVQKNTNEMAFIEALPVAYNVNGDFNYYGITKLTNYTEIVRDFFKYYGKLFFNLP